MCPARRQKFARGAIGRDINLPRSPIAHRPFLIVVVPFPSPVGTGMIAPKRAFNRGVLRRARRKANVRGQGSQPSSLWKVGVLVTKQTIQAFAGC